MYSWIALFIFAMNAGKSLTSDILERRMSEICFRETIESADNLLLNEVCEQRGVACHNEVIWKIKWGRAYDILKKLDWLPPSLRKVHFEMQTHPNRLNTRQLPRMLEFCWIVHCKLHGSVDLRQLPETLTVLYLDMNRISGTVNLTALPENIRYISMTTNEIRKVIVENSSLPDSLVRADFNELGQIMKIRTMNGSEVDDRVGCVGGCTKNYEREYEGW